MAILPTVGRKATRVRLTIWAIYALLLVGGLTMIVPFLIMVTASVSNDVDAERFDIVPAYWFRKDMRFAKYLAARYDELRFEHFAVAHGAPPRWSTFKDLGFEKDLGAHFPNLGVEPDERLKRMADDYGEFMDRYDPSNTLPLFCEWNQREMRQFLRGKYEALLREDPDQPLDDSADRPLGLLSYRWNEGLYKFWDYVNFEQEVGYPYHLQQWFPPDDARHGDYLDYVRHLPASQKVPITTHFLWCLFLLDRGVDVPAVDKQCGTDYGSIYRVPPGDQYVFPPAVPE